MPRNKSQQQVNLFGTTTAKRLRFHFCFQFCFHFPLSTFHFPPFPYAPFSRWFQRFGLKQHTVVLLHINWAAWCGQSAMNMLSCVNTVVERQAFAAILSISCPNCAQTPANSLALCATLTPFGPVSRFLVADQQITDATRLSLHN